MTLAEQIGRAMSDANKAHILTHQREMTLRELGEVAASALGCAADKESAAVQVGALSERLLAAAAVAGVHVGIKITPA